MQRSLSRGLDTNQGRWAMAHISWNIARAVDQLEGSSERRRKSNADGSSLPHRRRHVFIRGAVVAALVMTSIFGQLPEAEAARLTRTPHFTCNAVMNQIQIHIPFAGDRVEKVSYAWQVDRWNGRSWVRYTGIPAKLKQMFPGYLGWIDKPNLRHDGYYRVFLGLSWNQNGVQKSFGRYLNGGSYCRL
jgi:hypothetical protein